MTTTILPPQWTLQPFENVLAAAEASSLANARAQPNSDGLLFRRPLPEKAVNELTRRLSFARAVQHNGKMRPTVQACLERAAGGGTRKVTSHALHGLHPYKGKFYPQLARSLLNVTRVPSGGVVVDPFAGCGTSVLEASLLGIRGIGLDANPMAVLVSQAKLQLLSTPVEQLELAFRRLRDIKSRPKRLPDEDYLARWFPVSNMDFLRRAVPAIQRLRGETVRNGAMVALSSVLREASYQDPTQLRVGRRKSNVNIPELEGLFEAALHDILVDLKVVQSTAGVRWQKISRLRSAVVHGDARCLTSVLPRRVVGSVDAVITSPPYASALPYIDTDRLSLRVFGLLPNASQREAEERLIGNREVGDRDLKALARDLSVELRDKTWLPRLLSDVLVETLEVAQSDTSGFRKQRTPYLLFAYFRDMRRVLAQIAQILRPGGRLAMVIGDNTVAGIAGPVVVPTARIMAALAAAASLRREDELSKRLTSYGAADTVHQRNAMAIESVLIFRRLPEV